MTPGVITQVSATGDVTTRSAHLHAVVLTAGSDAASAVLKAGGSGGTTILTVKAATGTTVSVPCLGGVLASGGIHVTLSGTGPVASVVWS